MLVLNSKIYELEDFSKKFTNEEKEVLLQCFNKIQEYIKVTYMKEKVRSIVELQLHYNAYTHSYLVIDFDKNEVYISHRDHGCANDKYFCNDECSYEGWKYTMCLIVVEKWQEIKQILDDYFSEIKNIFDLGNNFEV